VKILGVAASNDPQTEYLAEYLCEMSLLHTDLSVYSHGMMAAACQLLARLTLNIGGSLLFYLLVPWPVTTEHLRTYIRS